jgi:hypothetical protein
LLDPIFFSERLRKQVWEAVRGFPVYLWAIFFELEIFGSLQIVQLLWRDNLLVPVHGIFPTIFITILNITENLARLKSIHHYEKYY